MADMPNIMSEKFQFIKPNTEKVYHSLDRLMNVCGTNDFNFDLVRIAKNDESK